MNLAQAKANLDLNQSIVKGREQLFAQGAIPGRDLDTAKAALVQAEAAYDTAKQHEQALQRVGTAATGQVAAGQLTSAKGKLLNAEAMASYASLRSPIDGVVTDRPLFAGEMAAAGNAVGHGDGHVVADCEAAFGAGGGAANESGRCGGGEDSGNG